MLSCLISCLSRAVLISHHVANTFLCGYAGMQLKAQYESSISLYFLISRSQHSIYHIFEHSSFAFQRPIAMELLCAVGVIISFCWILIFIQLFSAMVLISHSSSVLFYLIWHLLDIIWHCIVVPYSVIRTYKVWFPYW